MGKVIVFSSIAAAVLLLFMVNTTIPTSSGPLGILAVFFLLYVILVGVITFLLYGAAKLTGRMGRMIAAKRPPVVLTLLKSYYFASVLALGPVITLGMQSVSSVGVREVALISLLMVLGCIYVAKRAT